MKKLFYILSIMAIMPLTVLSQELKAEITTDMDLLGLDARNQVSDIAYQLENYISTTEFTDLDWEGEPVQVNLQITFQSGGNNRYSARLYVEALRPIEGGEASVFYRAMENEWNFNYAQGGIPTYNEMRYDNLATIIDYHMLMIIGLYADSYIELGGQQVFGQLRQLVSLGSSKQAPGFEMISSPGEFTKYNVVTELNDPRFDDFRLYMFDYYDAGLDMRADAPEDAMLNLEDIIYDMNDFKADKLSTPSVLMQMFFDSNSLELAAIFAEYKDGKVLNVLTQLDPSNGQNYRR